MVLGRAARDLGPRRPIEALTETELRAWLLGLRATLSPISVAGYVRGLKAFGNWCATEQLAEARGLRTLRRPRTPQKLVEPLSDEVLRRLLDAPSVRDRAIVLRLLDTGLRLSEVAGVRRCDLRADGGIKVLGKGARERIVPVGNAARQALLRYLRQTEGAPGDPVLRSRGGGPLGWRGIQQVFNRLKALTGIPGRCLARAGWWGSGIVIDAGSGGALRGTRRHCVQELGEPLPRPSSHDDVSLALVARERLLERLGSLLRAAGE
jgi:site-specific recombinase XerC